MQLIVDGRPLVGNRTGIGVHTAEIIHRLGFAPAPTIGSHAPIENREGIDHCNFVVDSAPLGVIWQQMKLPRIAGDILWGPHGTLPLSWRRPSVVTLHDFTSITMAARHRIKTIVSFNLFIARSLELATRVACVSRHVADQAIRSFGVPAWKIELVANGVDEQFFTPPDESSRGDYLLYAGTLEPRKGIDDLLAAWHALPAPRPRLVLCGDPGWGTKIEPAPGIEVTGFVTRERLRDLYRGSLAFVYPSHDEGFGIPPLEAMASGAPVIATRTGAIGEYAEGAAILIEPGDRAALLAGLRRLLGDASLRNELSVLGPQRAALWSWNSAARTMAALLKEALACE
ncbi:MAG TPA: glycosyltransferase family 1 protein [Thermoanaerobaculia bacterium]